MFHTHSHTHSLSLSHTHSLTHSLSLSHTHSLTHSLSFTHAYARAHIHTLLLSVFAFLMTVYVSYSLSLTLPLMFSFWLSSTSVFNAPVYFSIPFSYPETHNTLSLSRSPSLSFSLIFSLSILSFLGIRTLNVRDWSQVLCHLSH